MIEPTAPSWPSSPFVDNVLSHTFLAEQTVTAEAAINELTIFITDDQ
jgi:hypothetical protein